MHTTYVFINFPLLALNYYTKNLENNQRDNGDSIINLFGVTGSLDISPYSDVIKVTSLVPDILWRHKQLLYLIIYTSTSAIHYSMKHVISIQDLPFSNYEFLIIYTSLFP